MESKEGAGGWYPAKIIAAEAGEVKVHFIGWKACYDEWHCAASALLRSPDACASPREAHFLPLPESLVFSCYTEGCMEGCMRE